MWESKEPTRPNKTNSQIQSTKINGAREEVGWAGARVKGISSGVMDGS